MTAHPVERYASLGGHPQRGQRLRAGEDGQPNASSLGIVRRETDQPLRRASSDRV